jgi:hypothetical protein
VLGTDNSVGYQPLAGEGPEQGLREEDRGDRAAEGSNRRPPNGNAVTGGLAPKQRRNAFEVVVSACWSRPGSRWREIKIASFSRLLGRGLCSPVIYTLRASGAARLSFWPGGFPYRPGQPAVHSAQDLAAEGRAHALAPVPSASTGALGREPLSEEVSAGWLCSGRWSDIIGQCRE